MAFGLKVGLHVAIGPQSHSIKNDKAEENGIAQTDRGQLENERHLG